MRYAARVISLLLWERRGDLVDIAETGKVDLLGACRRLEREDVGSHRVRFEVLDADRVLRRACGALRRDDILARDRARADLDPDLPVGLLIAESQMLALDAVDDALSDMSALVCLACQCAENIAEKQVRARHCDREFVPELLDQAVHRAGHVGLRVRTDVLAENGKGLAVVGQFDIA
jgi:hypothetical protein